MTTLGVGRLSIILQGEDGLDRETELIEVPHSIAEFVSTQIAGMGGRKLQATCNLPLNVCKWSLLVLS